MVISGIVGLDPSLTGFGFARIDGVKTATRLFKTKPTDGSTVLRSLHIAKAMIHHMKKYDIVFIEDYAFGIHGKVSSLTTLGELGGIIKAIILKFTGHEPFTVTTSEMRKFLSGDGKLKKDMIPVAALRRYGAEFTLPSHDECVALAIADLGNHIIMDEPWFPAPHKYQKEIINRLREKYLKELKAISEK